MSQVTSIAITGTGAVSAAGWGVEALMETMRSGKRPAMSMCDRPCGEQMVSTPVLRVPMDGASIPKAARLRRTSPISKFAAAATLQALGEQRLAAIREGLRVGVILTLTNGCVNYSNRFFAEVVADPTLASPILFPETVFNAPSSHLSAMIGSHAPNDSLIGDGSGFLTGMDLAAEWISRGDVDGCIVVAAEEIDWLSAEGLCLYSKQFTPAEGAAAIYMEPGEGMVNIIDLPDPIPYNQMERPEAAIAMRQRLSACDETSSLLVDSGTCISRFDHAEQLAWNDWHGARWSPKHVIGETMGASAGFQVVAAVEALRTGLFKQAVVSSLGSNQQAAAVLLEGGHHFD